MKLAIGYMRVSTGNQAESGNGLEAQKDTIQKYADDNGYTITEWLVDEGVSGDTADRPAFDQIVYGEVKNPPVEAVIVATSDRVARDFKVYFGFDFLIGRKGIKLISVQEDFGEFGPFAGMIQAFVATMAELERAAIYKRTLSGRAVKARKGGYSGGSAPLGYKVVDKELVIDENEVDKVKAMFEFRDRGDTLREIAENLAKRGYLTRNGTVYSAASIKRILDNEPTYRGYYKYGDMDEWVIGQHEPILQNLSVSAD